MRHWRSEAARVLQKKRSHKYPKNINHTGKRAVMLPRVPPKLHFIGHHAACLSKLDTIKKSPCARKAHLPPKANLGIILQSSLSPFFLLGTPSRHSAIIARWLHWLPFPCSPKSFPFHPFSLLLASLPFFIPYRSPHSHTHNRSRVHSAFPTFFPPLAAMEPMETLPGTAEDDEAIATRAGHPASQPSLAYSPFLQLKTALRYPKTPPIYPRNAKPVESPPVRQELFSLYMSMTLS